MNRVTFHVAADRRGEVEYISARIVLPDGREFHVGYHPNIGTDGQRDGINFGFNGCWQSDAFVESADTHAFWVEDLHADDLFCSELFAELTGFFPYEIEEGVKSNQDFAPMLFVGEG